jgi:GrpB-like predicted nucleotidyltransferase (UPF0157 family)
VPLVALLAVVGERLHLGLAPGRLLLLLGEGRRRLGFGGVLLLLGHARRPTRHGAAAMPRWQTRRMTGDRTGRAPRIELVDPDPMWPARFQAEAARLARVVPGLELHHIGSTAVPGLPAKPIVDLMARVEDLDAAVAAFVERGGYQRLPADAPAGGRRCLCRPSSAHRTHHLHLVDDPRELARHLRFRDALHADPALAASYAALKRELAERFADDREAYAEAKTPFIARVTAG